jgi:hypothetical protein
MLDIEIDTTDDAAGQPVTESQPKTPAMLVSVLFHLALLSVFAAITVPVTRHVSRLVYTTSPLKKEVELPLITQALPADEIPVDEVGTQSLSNELAADSQALQLAETTAIPAPELSVLDTGRVEIDFLAPEPVADQDKGPLIIRGSGGTAVTGARGAIDRITHEVLLSLEQQPTLVVWLLDQSASVYQQRQEIRERLDRIYSELGQVQSADTRNSKTPVEPLLSSVIAFGSRVSLLTPRPTSDVAELQHAVASVVEDDTGVERIFEAVQLAVDRYHCLRKPNFRTPPRNIMLVAFTDEVGDDQHLLDRTVNACRRWEIPVYVVGIPSPLGRTETLVKWVDPDPNFDQSPKWGVVNQGPESLQPELLHMRFADGSEHLDHIDSGFGPFALTRLCVETGGIYFTVHPNRRVGRPVGRWEIDAYTAHLNHFFSPDVMRRYRPDYVSFAEYQKNLADNPMRRALVQAASQSWITPLGLLRPTFVVRSEAQLAAELTEAQKEAARLEPEMERLYELLRQGEKAREDEQTPRWQAGYDLAMGRILANKVRTQGYNVMLAQAKRGLQPSDPSHNTWNLIPSREVGGGGMLESLAESARGYLLRVANEHKETPWALLAQKELELPMGYRWKSSYTELSPERVASSEGSPAPPSDDQLQMLVRPRPSRPVPRL